MRWRLALAAILIATPAAAAETGGCGAFKWAIAPDLALLESPKWVDSGATLDLQKAQGLRVKLGPLDQAGFALPPERAPAPAGQNGSLRFEAKAGIYQITLTEPAWTDLVQDGVLLKPSEFSGVKDCEGARKSLRYDLKAGPAVLQISNAPGRSVGVAITPPH
jgi:hypothetical protein